ncbi:MAG TPA: efflux RND transporter periplasmic adaptor subunit [Rhizomicrobium sp.]|jgi:multidrug efflux system membrane fusion protein|nr:efflux RND transporter periplasmic adaptor subunit [Rhizomicrobium sp.]
MLGRILKDVRAWWDRVQPGFWRRMNSGYRAAVVILILVVAWVGSGFLTGAHAPQSQDTADAKANDISRVQVATLIASARDATITIRGRTQALHSVDTRAQVDGIVKTIHFEKGDRVKAGDVLCELVVNDRGAKLDQAKALVAERQKEWDAADNLVKQGAMSATAAKQAMAALEAAKAEERTQDIELGNTSIRAPFSGLVDDRYVNVGDYMRVGDKCELVIAPEPFLAVGAVSEQDVGKLKIGAPANATLVSGENVAGKVYFVATKADATTRTFRVEIELPNPDARLRDGISADIHIPVKQVEAMKISPGILVLNDNGVVGVRTVQSGIVHFQPVNIVSDGPDGMWVTGLPTGTSVITVGQEFVAEGSRVKAVPAGARA